VLKSDIISEPDKVFYLQLTNPVNCHPGVTNVAGTILNDTACPAHWSILNSARLPHRNM